MVKTASRVVAKTKTVEEALRSKEVTDAIGRGIFKITKLHKPARRTAGGNTRDRLDWQDLFATILLKLSDPTVGFAAAHFSPEYAYGVAKNTSGEWLRERMKERPRQTEGQENNSTTFPVQFDPKLESKPNVDPENVPNTLGFRVVTLEDLLEKSDYETAKFILQEFAASSPADHAWLMDYMSTRRTRKHTNAEHQRAARLYKKLRREWNHQPEPDDSEVDSELELEAA